jgi:hypothetical protein
MSEGVQIRKGDLVALGSGPLHIVKRCEGDELDAFCGWLARGCANIDHYFVGRKHNYQRFSDQVCEACKNAYRPSRWNRLRREGPQEPL